MDWFLYDRQLRHKDLIKYNIFHVTLQYFRNVINAFLAMVLFL